MWWFCPQPFHSRTPCGGSVLSGGWAHGRAGQKRYLIDTSAYLSPICAYPCIGPSASKTYGPCIIPWRHLELCLALPEPCRWVTNKPQTSGQVYARSASPNTKPLWTLIFHVSAHPSPDILPICLLYTSRGIQIPSHVSRCIYVPICFRCLNVGRLVYGFLVDGGNPFLKLRKWLNTIYFRLHWS